MASLHSLSLAAVMILCCITVFVSGFGSAPSMIRLSARQSSSYVGAQRQFASCKVIRKTFLSTLQSHETSAAKENVALEHRGVPTEHQGLHSALYGDGDDHGVSDTNSQAELLLTDARMPVEEFLGMSKGKVVAGVYSIIGSDGMVKYINIARNLHLAISALSNGVEAADCATIRVMTTRFPRREDLQHLQRLWLSEFATAATAANAAAPAIPPGNADPNSKWELAVRELSRHVSDDERRQLEDKKLKLRRAMADSSLIDEMPQVPEEEKMRRTKMMLAVEGDDWSAEINRQTSEVSPAAAAAAGRAGGDAGDVISPFKGGANSGGIAAREGVLEFTMENVDRVLDEVRPYMVADGGNCRVVGVDSDTGDVRLLLEGACGSCPSSTVTLKMGVERALREKFGDKLGQVISVEPAVAAGAAGAAVLTKEVVEGLLAPVRPAVMGLGGSLKVMEIDAAAGAVTIEYKGPAKLTYGLEMTLKESPLVKSVAFV